MISLVAFRIRGRIGHFLRAEAGVSALSYPIPPRTSILGIIGAVLGLPKDKPQELLDTANISLAGNYPLTHWHKAKLRKDPPESLPYIVKKNQKIDKNTKPEKTALIAQEWLFNPEYTIWTGLPEPFHSDFEIRLKERQWHFQPCLGLSEMLAEIEYHESVTAEKLSEGVYHVHSVVNQGNAKLDVTQVYERSIALQILRMPRKVTTNRVFIHATYIMEKDALPIPVTTNEAYRVGEKVLMFL